MKKILPIILAILMLLGASGSVFAVYKPASVTNNKFGIHITDSNDLIDAANLVNGGGGDWGYVTFVIQKGERDTARWTEVFKRLRELHLVPIVRVATKPILSFWERPSIDEIDGWVSFLDSLPWPTKNRYVLVGNEPNHAQEWGGNLRPKEYASYLVEFSAKLKKQSDKFYVLGAGFDSSASNSFFSMDEEYFIRQMILAEPKVFDSVDGWASHSYPNPGFTGSETDTGRRSISSYKWELELLKSLGVDRDFDVFITETGWAHNVKAEIYNNVDPADVGRRFDYAFNNVWNDEKVIAVTPFILNYGFWPFDIFSWKDKEGNYYDFYYQVMNMPKERGNPILEPTPTPIPSPSASPMPAPIPESTPIAKEGPIKGFFSKIRAFLLQYVHLSP